MRGSPSHPQGLAGKRQGDSMTAIAQRETPQVGIFWLVQMTEGEAARRSLSAGPSRAIW
jgi:hypothetical protein